MEKILGLIGYPLSHSFSKKHFTKKFFEESILDYRYELFPLEKIELFPALIKENPQLVGLNVTIPYKEKVMEYLDEIDEVAKEVGAVNTIKITNGKLKGYNTDVYGFQRSMTEFLFENRSSFSNLKAIVLGTGGASKAVCYVLNRLNIKYLTVSRSLEKGDLRYEDLTNEHLEEFPLFINTTPLGMSPYVEERPRIPYKAITDKNFLIDLIYNPNKTVFLLKGEMRSAPILNGLPMLIYQAEKAWQIWTKED